jgi:hypothetical protein
MPCCGPSVLELAFQSPILEFLIAKSRNIAIPGSVETLIGSNSIIKRLAPNWINQRSGIHTKYIKMETTEMEKTEIGTTEIETTTDPAIVDAIVDLQTRGFFFDFTLLHNRLFCAQQQCFFGPDDFMVLEKYSFQKGILPGRKTDVFGIESLSYGLKGILLK